MRNHGSDRMLAFSIMGLHHDRSQKQHLLTQQGTTCPQLVVAIRILHEHLPTLLLAPLPQEVLSPQITLYLFPSTHPHLPTVSGRIAYTAALWTAPVAWGSMPMIGNVKLAVLSERLFRNGNDASGAMARSERLVVRWKTCAKSKAPGDDLPGLSNGEQNCRSSKGAPSTQTTSSTASRHSSSGKFGLSSSGSFLLGRASSDKSNTERRHAKEQDFSGLFIFEFDECGRIVSHTIEQAQEGENWDKMTRVISVTDWLLGKAWGKKQDDEAGLALGFCDSSSAAHTRLRPFGRPVGRQ